MKRNIIEFLEERPGYRKEGKRRLQKVLGRHGLDVSLDECAEALKEFNTIEVDIVSSETISPGVEVPEGFEIKSMWQQGDKMMFSYKPINNVESKDILDDAIEQLAEYNAKRPFFPLVNEGSGIKVHAVADLHIGSYVRGLLNTPDFDTSIVSAKLQEVADEINSQNNKENHVAILGDLIESFTGLNHINSWKSMEQGMYGGNVLILAYEIILDFLSRIENLTGVYIVAGNHDRVTSNNSEDTEGDAAKIIAYFLEQRVNCPVVFNSTVISVEIDGLNYILHHGHKGFSRGALSDIVLAFGIRGMFSVVLSGHLHTRAKKDQTTYINEDNKKYRAYGCPSIFTGNEYSEGLNYTSISGFLSVNSKHGIPQVIDTPIQ